MAEKEEDFSQLPLTERFVHKIWKVRKEGYEAAIKEFELTPDESDPVFTPFLRDAGIWKGVAGDSNVAAQQEGLAALCAFLKYGGEQAASRTRNHTISPIYEKGLSSTRAAAKANAQEALLLYVEIDKPDLVIEELLPALSNKQPKIIAATLATITAIFHAFGVKVVDAKPVIKQLPKVFGHADKNVRAEASNLAAELYRWLKEAMKPIFWNELKPVQQQDLEKLFDKIKEEPAPKQERFTRSQQAQKERATATVGNDVGGDAVMVEPEEEEAVEVDVFDLAEPVDVYSKVPAEFNEMVNSTKWKDRKEMLDSLFNLLNTPRIKDGPYDEIVRALAKCMKDANIAVVTVAANCVEKLAQGLRRGFAKYRSTIMSPIMERFKEKKQSVTDALGAALDAVFISTSLTDCLEETLGFLTNKNPNVKGETCKFLVRCLRTTRDVPPKPEQKSIADAAAKLLTESTEAMRTGGAEILGTLMKIIGERAMGPYLDGVDDIKKAKIKEFFETAEVKAKEKPKPVAPAPKAAAASAVGKKVVGGSKKPMTKRPTAPTPTPIEEPPAPAPPKSVAKALPKPGLAKPGLAQPSGLKLGGLKKPATGASSPQRRVVSPPVESEEENYAPTPSKFGAGRGLAGRPLARPAATPMSPQPVSSSNYGVSAMERAELEELRAERERLTGLTDHLRSTNAKLNAEISELQNQNAQLIEDHTRDVLQIKAKETQLVRARGECEVLKSEMETFKKETDRYKREVSRLGRESIGRERDDLSRGRQYEDPTSAEDVYDDSSRYPQPPQSNTNGNFSRPASSNLQRNTSTTSAGNASSRPASAQPPRPRSGFNAMSPSEEKENNGFDSFGANRRKLEPPMATNGSSYTSGASSPQRPLSREPSGATDGGNNGAPKEPAENWKRAAEVTSQLKARIEAMKARQGLNRS